MDSLGDTAERFAVMQGQQVILAVSADETQPNGELFVQHPDGLGTERTGHRVATHGNPVRPFGTNLRRPPSSAGRSP